MLERFKFRYRLKVAYAWVALWFYSVTKITLVPSFVSGTSSLELQKNESRRLPPVDGVYGPFIIAGNALPVVTYKVFDDLKMEFVSITAYLSLPHKVEIRATTKDLGEVRVQPDYALPLYRLLLNVHGYFPLLPDQKEPARVLA